MVERTKMGVVKEDWWDGRLMRLHYYQLSMVTSKADNSEVSSVYSYEAAFIWHRRKFYFLVTLQRYWNSPPPVLCRPLRKHCWVKVGAIWQWKSFDRTLSNGKEIIFLGATIPLVLSINHRLVCFCQVAFLASQNVFSIWNPVGYGTSWFLAESCL
jgi:hypothetical protein